MGTISTKYLRKLSQNPKKVFIAKYYDYVCNIKENKYYIYRRVLPDDPWELYTIADEEVLSGKKKMKLKDTVYGENSVTGQLGERRQYL